ncbi:hypothetical protein BGZ49_007674 [Haplosporangium sp. Z 27]|nr:hypothetical protein BGZ49_007674 [Haplosporangium sp. Z 27]
MTSRDYRVSTIVVLCKDCGNDVGAYPGLHKCPPPPSMPAMPSIPSKYQPTTSYSSSSSRSSERRPPDLKSDSSYSGGGSSSYGSSRTPTSSSFQDRINGSSSRTPTATSFQERMRERDREKQQREREEREAAARAVREDSQKMDMAAPSSTTTTAAGSGTTFWSRLRAAKDVINATITGEEKWPDSDDSDYEGESHVCRILRDYGDKKEERELAAKIAELEMTPVESPGSLSRATGASRNQYLRDDNGNRREPRSGTSSTSSNERGDYHERSLRTRGERSGGSESARPSNNNYGSNSSLDVNPSGRYRSTSDVSRDDALSRLEGKSQGDKLATQVSHLGSTSPRRAHSPNGRQQQNPSTSNNQYQQYGNQNQLSPPSANGGYSDYSNSSSQRSASPNSSRRYDSPSPSGSGRYGGPQQPSSPSYPNNSSNGYRPQPGPSPSSRGGDPYSSRSRGPDPGQGYGRSDYDRRPAYPPTGGVPPSNKNLGYGQRPHQQHPHQQHQHNQYQQHSGYGAQGNYF